MQWWVDFCYGRVYMWVPDQGRLLLVWNRLFKIIVHWFTRLIMWALALARVRYGRLREICTLSLSDARVNDLTINTNTNWPSTQTHPDHQHNPTMNSSVHKQTINTTSTTISNQHHWIQRTFLRHSGQVTGNYSPLKISKLHTKRYSSSKKQISEVKNLKAY